MTLAQKKAENRRILIIDDEPFMRVSLRETLEAAGYEVVEAVNGMEAVDFLSDVKPDVMITDILMPEKEGFATIRDYRTIYPDLPIIAISGANNVLAGNVLDAAGKLGADHTLAKPFGPHELLNLVREALNNS